MCEKLSINIILDSNFLFIPLEFRIDLLKELENIVNRKIEVILLSPVYEELKKLSQKKGVAGKKAKMALKYANQYKLEYYNTDPNETVDDFLIRIAQELKGLVATNDKILKTRLRERDIPVIYLRRKAHLEIKGKLLGKDFKSHKD